MLLPCGLVAWQVGPGRALLGEDRAGWQMRRALQSAAQGDWSEAAAAYQAAAAQLPDHATSWRHRLKFAEAQALAEAGQLDASRQMLTGLLTDMQSDPRADSGLCSQVRHALATASYYAAWRMRLEGKPEGEWRRLVHQAQDQFQTLARDAQRETTAADNHLSLVAGRQAPIFRRNLEAAVKLQAMPLPALQEKTLPPPYARDLALTPPAGSPDVPHSDRVAAGAPQDRPPPTDGT